MKKLPDPLLTYLSPIAPYVETETEIDKTSLISRIAGKVEYSVLQIVKCLVFYRISKNEEGELMLR